jgi:hypothetical protein
MVRKRLNRILMVAGSVLAVGLGLGMPPAFAATPALPPGTITITFPNASLQDTFVDEANGTVYAQTAADNVLHAIDIATGTLTASIPLSTALADDAIDQATDTIYAGSATTNTITVISGSTNTVTGTITLPPYGNPTSLAFDPGTGLLYAALADPVVLGSQIWGVVVVDPASGTVVTTIDVPGLSGRFTLDPQHDLLYATPRAANEVMVVSTVTDSVVSRFQVLESGIDGFATPLLNPSGSILYIVSGSSVASYTTSTDKQLGEVFFPSDLEIDSGALDSTTGNIYKSVTGSSPSPANIIEQVNGTSDTVTGTIPISGTTAIPDALPGPVAFDQATGTLVLTTDEIGPNDEVLLLLIPLTATTAITSASTATFTADQAGTFTITAPGTPAPTFTEAGHLPAGVTLSPAGTLSGTPARGTNGSYHITITADNGRGTPVTQQFTLNVAQPPPPIVTYKGTIRLYKMGLCLDDRNNSSSNGAVAQVWRCNGLPNQQWQVMSDGTIRHNGLCLDATGYGITNGTKVQLWACTGNGNQKWDTKTFRIHYDNPAATGKVLDDTGYGGIGTQQQIWTNNGTINQNWETT